MTSGETMVSWEPYYSSFSPTVADASIRLTVSFFSTVRLDVFNNNERTDEVLLPESFKFAREKLHLICSDDSRRRIV